jgi:periplasmic copper chaperone A
MRVIRISTVIAAVGVLVALAAPAFAHVTANPNTGPQEGRVTTFFNVGHGCDSDGPNTTQLSIQIPEGVIGATPEEEPGWTAETKMRKLDEPIEGEGEEITEVVSEVIWTADEPLDEHAFRQFGIGLNIAAPGEEVLYFPTVQQCEEGAIRWVNIPDSLEAWGDTEDPAPYLELAPAEEEGAMNDAALTEDDVRAIAASEASAVAPESGTDPMVWVAVALGALGLLLGLMAFSRSGRASE